MATDGHALSGHEQAMTLNELVTYTRKELEADAARQARVAAEGGGGGGEGEVQGQTGATLDLSHKNIQALPVEVIVLIKDRVERLALSHNPQIAVPTQIVQCDRLRYLNIRWNQLKYFPEAVLQLSSLEILDISKNRIVAIPEGIKRMTSLKFLAVARNKITRLPLALGDMPSLSKLKFDENPIEYPPLEALQTSSDRMPMGTEPDKEKDMCQQVKRFLKAASLRERLRTPLDEDSGEANLETPRPPRRTMTAGRFPVRPSISSIDNIDDLRTKSPQAAPPIPMKSQDRVTASNVATVKRPGIAPLLTGISDTNRSHSETVSSSSSLRIRRQGFVPRKPMGLVSLNESDDAASLRSGSASAIRLGHSRQPSSASTLNGFPTTSSGGETSSGAVSPIDGPTTRSGGSVRRLSSLPENRNIKVQISGATKAAKRLLFILFRLHGPMGEVTAALKGGTPRRSLLERQLFTANAHVVELDRLLSRLEQSMEDDSRAEEQGLKPVVRSAIAALKSYGVVVSELRHHTRKVVSTVDAVYIRCLVLQIYVTVVEARNICTILGFKLRTPAPRSAPRVARAWSSRTVTPTQQATKPINNRRMRGATILQSMASSTSLRSMVPVVPLNGSSRTNTMTSFSAATPYSNDSFSSHRGSAMPSRSNTMRSGIMDDTDTDEQFGPIFLKLKSVCDLAAHSLLPCRTEFVSRRASAETAGQMRAAQAWSTAINKCDALNLANNALIGRLKVVKLKDPGVRNQRDFWQLCDGFVRSWAELVTAIRDVADLRLDTTSARAALKPVQKAVKEVSKTISESPLYHQAPIRPTHHPHPYGHAHGNTSLSATTSSISLPSASAYGPPIPVLTGSSSGTQSGYTTPVPATPLGAALGPAVQATVSMSSTLAAHEYLQAGAYGSQPQPHGTTRAMHERVDTVMQPPPTPGKSGPGRGAR